MAKGSSQPTQTATTQSVLAPEQKQILDLAMPGISSFAASVPKRYQGSTVAGFTPEQLQGQQMALDAAGGGQSSLATSATDANNFLLTDIWNPSSNPGLQGAINAAVRPITENYQQVVRPALRDEFTGAGQQFGGSRRALAEGQAANAYMRNVGDTSSKIAQDQYSNNLAAYVRGLGLVPTTQQAAVAPAITTSGVGDVKQAMAQALLGEQVGNWNYDQLAPFLQSKELISLLTGIPGGSTTTTAQANTPGQNKLSSALGGAASGAALGSAIFPGVGTAVGAGIGGLMGFL